MSRLTLLIIFLFSYLPFYGKQDVDGVYIDTEFGDSIIIKSNYFLYKTKEVTHMPVYYEDTVAICSIVKVDEYIYEINSTYMSSVIPATKVVCNKENIDNDSIKIHFQVPYSKERNKLCFSVFYEVEKKWPYESVECDEDNVAFIPKTIKSFRFDVSPTWYDFRLLDGRYYGLLFYASPYYEITPNCNNVEVSIPVLNNGFFERYYPYHEYIYIKNNKLHWKGKVFKKVNQRMK